MPAATKLATGVPGVLRQAVDCLAPRGTCGSIGAAAMGTEVSLDMNVILTAGRAIRGKSIGVAPEAELASATAADNRRIAAVDAGQGVGMVTDAAPVGEVIDRLCTGARELLARWA